MSTQDEVTSNDHPTHPTHIREAMIYEDVYNTQIKEK